MAALDALPFGMGVGLAALAGLLLGSFLATLVLRWPLGRSVLRGRSLCDACGTALTARDLIPLLSAIAARGRCRHCGAPIDAFHWRVELLSAAIGAALLPIAHLSHLLLLALGAVSAQVRRDRAALMLLALLGAALAQIVLVGVWFEFAERHRAFLTPFVLLPIAAAWPAILGWATRLRDAQSFTPLLRADR